MSAERASGLGNQAGGPFARWWGLPDQFDWLSGYLRARGLAWPTKILMALISAALIFMGAATPTMRNVPPVWAWTFGMAAVLTGITYSTLWLRGWPTRARSLRMAFLGSTLIAVGCVMQTYPMVALMGCTGLAVVGGYAAFFHNSKAITFIVVLGIAVGALCATRVVPIYGWAVAGAGWWLVVELNVAVPLAIQAVMRTMGADVVRSDQDPLTGVLNRRAFYERATTLLTSPGHDLHLVVVMIDLDEFKKLNDAYGHLAGDQALTAVGWVLRETSTTSAIIGRFGGEEFIVIDAVPAEVAEQLPAQLCAAIAALPQPVTASVGAAIVRWDGSSAMDDLIQSADAAMYAAKRAGGNQTRICRPARVER
ncbi:diguanylate cyclase (GGDEF)-like protein [Mycolicibacterium sp. BK556]|uniref:GGDEF domain-containing protein n=1 Tax=unclassified Mycolicibacterium TaxID=2636767 RepID=UPI00161E6529|nr:diguanylate cyclase (GGDEF)-like protein [Mycolicibacterium sp. BK556]MBB3630773.1 diguanylate cyclase (GGDEF)-like protein [Mycolicibacterium sp. BK607]MBB3748769.1 diguanylate cyclase (GGDEF)-like protein [Mycolicibacterium sp. BK634]